MQVGEPPARSDSWSIGAGCIGLGVAALGVLVLFGWVLDVPAIVSVIPGLSSMKPNTAAGFLLIGTALWRLSIAKGGHERLAAQACASIAAVIGLLTLMEYALDTDIGIDQFIIADPYTPSDAFPGRMSVITAFCFVLFWVGTISLPIKPRLGPPLFVGSTMMGLLAMFAAILGYLLHSRILYNPFPSASIAIHTACAFLLAFVGLAALRPDRGLPALLRSPGAGGSIARRLLPVVFLLMPCIAWIRLQGEYAGLYDMETGLSLLTLTAVVILAHVVWFTGYQADKLDARHQASEERYRQVVDEIQEAIWVHADGRILFANRYAAKMLGAQSPQDLVGRTTISLVHPDDRELSTARMNRLHDGTQIPTTEMKMQRLDGSVVFTLVHAIQISDHGRQCVLSSARDITAQRDAEAQLRQSQKMESVGRLTGGVAHDFNNLLTVIIGNADLLIESDLNDSQLNEATAILRTGLRGAELVGQMLAFSRRQPLQPRSVDANILLNNIESMLQRTIGEDVDLKMETAEDLWRLFADPAQIETAILNLAVNARHAMPEGGKLTIETANVHLDQDYADRHTEVSPGDYVMVAVTDTGTGMPEHVIERAFEPFFTTKDPGKGTGLGLSMIFGFVKQSRGHVKIYSEVGEGTTVKLYLPRDIGPYDAVAAPDSQREPKSGTETILLVEDDENVRLLAAGQLNAFGYRVLQAPDGPTALAELAAQESIDLLFTDVVLPGGMNGRQLADKARELRPGMKVLYASGYTENAIIHQGRLDPGVHLLMKPYRSGDLGHMVRKVLDHA